MIRRTFKDFLIASMVVHENDYPQSERDNLSVTSIEKFPTFDHEEHQTPQDMWVSILDIVKGRTEYLRPIMFEKLDACTAIGFGYNLTTICLSDDGGNDRDSEFVEFTIKRSDMIRILSDIYDLLPIFQGGLEYE